ncbi:MAG: prolyl oligopeptidase family serine peptidase [Verrucomicrobiae bacterium]|nr:prolyl oligopeptidase family serine peptidase [Verrucomicrobiae bacterium]
MKLSKFGISMLSLILLNTGHVVLADGPSDNLPEQVRPVPPEGIVVSPEQTKQLGENLELLDLAIQSLRGQKEHAAVIDAYLPDVEICHRSVRDALKYGEFFSPKEIEWSFQLLQIGMTRAAALKAGETPWTRETGNVIRAYLSRIDGSAQPYGLEIPAGYDFDGGEPIRLDFWFHGRGEKLSEVSFLQQRAKGSGGKVKPENAIVLHPYGRYSNANKFAGEVDLFEALDHARRDYRIDEDRIFVRGFSMGGAACWQFAVHHAGLWAGAQPGAGFSETPDFLKTFQGETLSPTWWEEKLWRWYDATNWAINLSNTPTIAYSGEIDRQKQAADMMVEATEKVGLRLVHLIGPETAHALHPATLAEIEGRLANIAEIGRQRVPQTVRFVTYTLRYDRMHWVRVDRMSQHWEKAQIDATMEEGNRIKVKTEGVEAFSLVFPSGECPLDPAEIPQVIIDGKNLQAPRIWTDRSWEVGFDKDDAGIWKLASEELEGLTKHHGLQGPIDDAFMDSFLMISPTGTPMNSKVGGWCGAEMEHAITHWRRQFRGDARVKTDAEVTDEDIANHNLVLWGDPQSNAVLKRIAAKLPIHWEKDAIMIGDQSFDSSDHAVVMIYPNPLNPDRYLVLNSGFTYREYDYLNNARQTPKLPDWAVVDLKEPVSTRWPGGIPAAGFFGEKWELLPIRKK